MLPISKEVIEGIQGSAFSGENVVGGLGRDEGLWPGDVLPEAVADRGVEVVDAGASAAADAVGCELGLEAFDRIEPGRAGGREMQLEARVFLQPGLHLGGFVGGMIVEHDVGVARLEDWPVDAAPKGQEFPGLWGAGSRR